MGHRDMIYDGLFYTAAKTSWGKYEAGWNKNAGCIFQ